MANHVFGKVTTKEVVADKATLLDIVTQGPWLDVRVNGSIPASIAAVGGIPTTIVYAADQTLTADISVPSHIELLPLNGAKINHGSYAVTYAGSTERWPQSQIFSGTGTVAFIGVQAITAEWVGIKGDNLSATGTANTANLQRVITGAIAAAVSGACKKVVFQPGKTYHFAGGVTIGYTGNQDLARGFKFVGGGVENPDQGSGTMLRFNGSGNMFQLGGDDGNPEATNAYTGPQGFYLENLQIRCFLTGAGKAATTCIRDYYAGNVCLDNVVIWGFGTGYYGARSDLNLWSNVLVTNCNLGMNIRPLSNQFTLQHCNFFTNGMDFLAIDPEHIRFENCQFVGSGTASGYGAEIQNTKDGSAYPQGWMNTTVFDNCWFENYQQNIGVSSYVYIHSTHTNKCLTKGIIFNSPIYKGAFSWTSYLLRFESANIIINNPSVHAGLKALVRSDCASLLDNSLTITGNLAFELTFAEGLIKETTVGATNLMMVENRPGSAPTFTSTNGRVYSRRFPDNGMRTFYIGANGDKEFNVVFPETGETNTTRLSFQRKVIHGTAAPTTETWQQGDKVYNRSPVAGGSEGWVCVTSGTPGTWKTFGSIAE